MLGVERGDGGDGGVVVKARPGYSSPQDPQRIAGKITVSDAKRKKKERERDGLTM